MSINRSALRQAGYDYDNLEEIEKAEPFTIIYYSNDEDARDSEGDVCHGLGVLDSSSEFRLKPVFSDIIHLSDGWFLTEKNRSFTLYNLNLNSDEQKIISFDNYYFDVKQQEEIEIYKNDKPRRFSLLTGEFVSE